MNESSRIFVAGHRGLVGSALVRKLRQEGFERLILKRRDELDLQDQTQVDRFFSQERPQYVLLAAAKVGGIKANDSAPAQFIHSNLAIQTNVIHSAWRHGVSKLLFLGSSCIYPKHAAQPMHEDALLTGPLEPTNQWYAIAKIAGLMMCQAYRCQYGFRAISAMPTNLYGPGDNFNLDSSHVLPALIRRLHEAKLNHSEEVKVWGTGRPRREFLHVDDLADACVHLLRHYEGAQWVNVGWGEDLSIAQLAQMVAEVVGFEGQLRFDPDMPDGTPRKLLDTTAIRALGWQPRIPLREGIQSTYQWFLEHQAEYRC